MMGREQGLCRDDIEYGIRNMERGNQTKPFGGTEFAWRGAGLVGLERERKRWVYLQDARGLRTVSRGSDLQVPL